MARFARVKVFYEDIAADILPKINLPIFGRDVLNGENIYETNFGPEGLIVMGNEGNGLRPEIEKLINTAVTIPRRGNAESLNVAIATALFCSEISRKPKQGKEVMVLNCRT